MKQICRIFYVISFMVFSFLSAEEVAKFAALDSPEKYKNKTIKVPFNTVAMDNSVFANTLIDSASIKNASSVFFVIDNSGSMYAPNGTTSSIDTTKPFKDRWGSRFSVARALLDTLYNKNPNIEVGVAVFATRNFFCKKDDDKIFESYPVDSSGAYIKLLKLNQQYESTTQLKTGYDILKHYLQTDSITKFYKYTKLKYTASVTSLQAEYNANTNITCGFESAKRAMKNASSTSPDQHFIIFFSDGEANEPANNPAETWKFMSGKEVPTTFSIYFTVNSSDVAPVSIKTMTDSIKINGYSNSNQMSNLWSIKTDHPTLMQFLMSNVIPKILTKVTTLTPSKLTVNGSVTSNDWQNKAFPFDKLFPLTGKRTEFLFDLTYKVSKNITLQPDQSSVLRNQEFITDTIKFAAEVQPDQTMDNIRLNKWGRKLGFYYDDSQITGITVDMNELDLRFTPYKVDTTYGYDNISVLLKTGIGDEEQFTLTKSADYFKVSFKCALGQPSKNNGIIEHASKDDYLIASWKNQDLPLDTLTIKIPFSDANFVKAISAAYFDKNADGRVDSLFIKLEGPVIEKDIDLMTSKMKLPAFRKFAVIQKSLTPAGISLGLFEGMGYVNTAVTNNDIISINDTFLLSNKTLFLPGTIKISDSVAPVIMRASFADTIIFLKQGDIIISKTQTNYGQLSVVFSELIGTIEQSHPFKFITPNSSTNFTATMNKRTQSDSIASFTLIDVQNSIKKINNGDSIWINWTVGKNVFDIVGKGNNQTNPSNIKRQLVGRTQYDTIETPAPYKLLFKATVLNLKDGSGITVPTSIAQLPGANQILKTSAIKDGISRFKVMILALEPDTFQNVLPNKNTYSATFSIFDALGNIIVSKKTMEYDPARRGLYYVWDGRNPENRIVGAGSYAVDLHIKYYFKEKLDKTETIRPMPMVGVKAERKSKE